MKKQTFKKSSLLSQKERDKLLIESAHKADMLITICVLHDCFGFGNKRINEFIDRFADFERSYREGNEDLKNIDAEIWERFGIKVM